ncbi:hypothetical protein lerEdw1_008500 [Lerista edwardsae]|nr:hypothetical protein lerEdw1_008500 [Lerista edwardsae]
MISCATSADLWMQGVLLPGGKYELDVLRLPRRLAEAWGGGGALLTPSCLAGKLPLVYPHDPERFLLAPLSPSAMQQLNPLWAAIGLSLASFPLSYMLNSVSILENPLLIALIGFGVLLALFAVVYLPNRSQDPFFYVCMVFSFTSVIDIIIALEEDGYISGFMEFYMREVQLQRSIVRMFVGV